jgi:hypothetical protein
MPCDASRRGQHWRHSPRSGNPADSHCRRLTTRDAAGLLRCMVPEPLHCFWGCRVHSCSSPFALHRAALVRGPGQVVPSEDYSHWPPAVAALFGERAKSPKQIKNMNTTNQNIAAPSVTIAPRNPARGVLSFVVTLTTHKDVRSYPCRSLESATKLAERFIASVTKPARPAAQAEPTPAPAAQPVAA